MPSEFSGDCGLRLFLGFSIEPKTEIALRQKRGLLSNISGERIREELVKLLFGENVQQVLLTYRSILGEVLPEIRPAFDFDPKKSASLSDRLGTHRSGNCQQYPVGTGAACIAVS